MQEHWSQNAPELPTADAGTQIADEETDVDRTGVVTVKGFATIDNVALINVEGTGMVGVQVPRPGSVVHIMHGELQSCSSAALHCSITQQAMAHADCIPSLSSSEPVLRPGQECAMPRRAQPALFSPQCGTPT